MSFLKDNWKQFSTQHLPQPINKILEGYFPRRFSDRLGRSGKRYGKEQVRNKDDLQNIERRTGDGGKSNNSAGMKKYIGFTDH